MLAVEAGRGVRTTYNILGTLFGETRALVAAHGHAVGFHSYDHAPGGPHQLARVRDLDLQVRGYRPARSELTAELSDYRFAYYNFEWLLCSALTFGFDACRLQNGIAKIPVHTDPDAIMAKISRVLGSRLCAPSTWSPAAVHPPMLELDRHDLLRIGAISRDRVGIWRTAGRVFSPESHETARLMGCAPA